MLKKNSKAFQPNGWKIELVVLGALLTLGNTVLVGLFVTLGVKLGWLLVKVGVPAAIGEPLILGVVPMLGLILLGTVIVGKTFGLKVNVGVFGDVELGNVGVGGVVDNGLSVGKTDGLCASTIETLRVTVPDNVLYRIINCGTSIEANISTGNGGFIDIT